MIARRFSIVAVLLVVLILLTMALPAIAFAKDRTHVVRRGETLAGIARRYGTSVSALAKANGIRNANRIYAGQRLRIPDKGSGSSSSGGSSSKSVHVVRRGDTLASIARRYGTSVKALTRANNIRNANRIYVGQRIKLSGSGSSGGSSAGSSGGSSGGSSKASVHIVRRGDTLASIARRYGTSVKALTRANGIRNANRIYVGQRIKLSGSGSSGGGSSAPASGKKWIEVDLSSQKVWAKRGDNVVRRMVVSTGISRYPTPTGRFRIQSKYRSTHMSGPGYSLPNVPHAMFFYRGYAFHGTYWHSNFGRPMSHGCINLTRSDAAWLYNWAPKGTLVVIHR